MKNSQTGNFFGVALWLSLFSLGFYGTTAHAACPEIDKDKAIQSVMAENAGSKILKVIEQEDKNGCRILVIRILTDGTVKAVEYDGKGN